MGSFKLIFEEMSAQYESLLESGNSSSDVVLVAGGKELCVHKLVLSTRSPVFAAMFAHSTTKEAQENRVAMVDVDVEVAELFVRYIYTGKVDMLGQYTADLLALADMYQVDSLKSICEKQLLSQVITTELVLDLLIFADMYRVTELTTKCLDYITDNVTRVRALEDWKKLLVKPHLLDKLIELLNVKYSKAIRIGQMKENFQNSNSPFNMASFDALVFEEMSDHYESLLKSGARSDVALLVGEKELKVHKLVLSTRSPFFAAMFTNYITKEIRLKVTDVDVQVLELWLRCIYTGKVDMLEQYAKELFVVADEFSVDCLKLICEQELLSQIAIESVCDLLHFAGMYQATGLYRQCLDYIANNVTQVMQQADWMSKIVLETDLLTQVYAHLLLDSSERQLLAQISTEPVTFLFSVDMFTVTKLSDECLDYIASNITQVMASERWMECLTGTTNDLLHELYEHLHLKYTDLMNLVNVDVINYQYRFVELEKKAASRIDYSSIHLRFDSKFQKYLLKNSNVINCKEESWDVILMAGYKDLKVHKVVLSAQSPVFARMFASHDSTNEVTSQRKLVQITNVDVKVLKVLIKYIYTGKVEIILDRYVIELLLAADKYQLDSLKSICEQKLLSNWTNLMVNLTPESVLDLIIFADRNQITELYLKCLDFIANNVTQVVDASVGWNKIVLNIDLLAKLCDRLGLNFCEQLLLYPITVKSVLNLLLLADMHQDGAKLTSKCVEFITDNVTEVLKEADWKKKIVLNAHLMVKLFEHLSKKYIREYTKVLDKERQERFVRYEYEMMLEINRCSDYDTDYDNCDYDCDFGCGCCRSSPYLENVNKSYNSFEYDYYYDHNYDHDHNYDYEYDVDYYYKHFD